MKYVHEVMNNNMANVSVRFIGYLLDGPLGEGGTGRGCGAGGYGLCGLGYGGLGVVIILVGITSMAFQNSSNVS